jgi:hypothetical protein
MLVLCGLVAAWVIGDLLASRHESFREFDGAKLGRLDAGMWRSYYERRPAALFWQLTVSHREQFHTGFFRSFPIAYRAARAAFTFKDGRSREDYGRALPDLERYYGALNAIAAEPFDAKAAARDELEWWIIRREPGQYTTADWERYIARVASTIYHRPPETMAEYARLRVQAMVLRDERGETITEADWMTIREMLERGWAALATAVRQAATDRSP